MRAHAASASSELALILGKATHSMELARQERSLLLNASTMLGGLSAQSNPGWVRELLAALDFGKDGESDDRLLSVLFSLSEGQSFDAAVLEPIWTRFRFATKSLLSGFGGSGERAVDLVF